MKTDNHNILVKEERLRVLIVEDEFPLRKLMDKFLQTLDFDIVCAENGAAAIEILNNNKFSIVISDIKMPHVDGIDLLRHVKQNYPHTDVIIMTGYSEKYSYNDVVNEGAIDFISKPIQLQELQAKLNRVIRERNTINELVKSRDVLEKKSAEEKENLLSRLMQAQKMEAIGTLAGGIAHDFNNILGVILGFADMARDPSSTKDQINRYIEKVLKAGYRAKNLVKQILTFSRQHKIESIVFQPAPLVKEALKFIRSSTPTSIEISHNIRNNCGNIKADPTQFHQIVMNLCTNAYHAMEGNKGQMKVTLISSDADNIGISSIPGLKKGNYVKLMVTDTGVGIDPNIKDRIFEPYFTTKEVDKGTGMGLAVVHGIVENYGGEIVVESELGKGTTFTVYIPIVENQVQIESKDDGEPLQGNERILFVDDEEMMSELGKDMLESLGYDVTAKSSSIEAFEKFKNQPDQFDLVITDQSMPGMTGGDLAERILQIRPDTPIILCTGFSTSISEVKAKSIGIKEFAFKPLVKKDIGKLIRKALN
jgi:signal transduction histidine kinase